MPINRKPPLLTFASRSATVADYNWQGSRPGFLFGFSFESAQWPVRFDTEYSTIIEPIQVLTPGLVKRIAHLLRGDRLVHLLSFYIVLPVCTDIRSRAKNQLQK